MLFADTFTSVPNLSGICVSLYQAEFTMESVNGSKDQTLAHNRLVLNHVGAWRSSQSSCLAQGVFSGWVGRCLHLAGHPCTLMYREAAVTAIPL